MAKVNKYTGKPEIKARCGKCGWVGPDRNRDADTPERAKLFATSDLSYHRSQRCKKGPNY